MARDFEASETTFLMKWTVEPGESGLRLDHFLKDKYRKRSREFIKNAIKDGRITLNNETSKPSRILRYQDKVHVLSVKKNEPEVNFDYKIIYEDADILVVDKPGNLPVHPSGRFFFNTLLTRLQTVNNNEIDQNLQFQIIHRIDRETSGILVIGKHKEAGAALMKQFLERTTKKEYLAIVRGVMPNDYYKIDIPLAKDSKSSIELRMCAVELDGQNKPLYLAEEAVLPALTEVFIAERFEKYTLVRVKPHTGRQHQIRVHLHHIGFPILGDKLYGVGNDDAFYRNLLHHDPRMEIEPGVYLSRHALHAVKLGFMHPRTKEPMEFSADLPEELKSLLYKELH